MGILPREFHSESELTPQAKRAYEAGKFWPTPNATVANDGEEPETWRARQVVLLAKHMNGNGAGVPLAIAAKEFWATPRASDGEKGGPNQSFGAGGTPLPTQAAKLWATPSARDWKSGEASEETMDRNSRPLSEQACHLPLHDQTTLLDGKPFSFGGRTLRPQLSSLFVEWLMGARLGTSCVCSLSHACAQERVD